ncbi:MAG: hypothetical protein BRD50_01295 [Bacteroidetes bacterium SW_11_45_7]|nr:MAG: hypothetical protein BRD50_01295 [Bacteroidetes bacterium SW_11_45_7]
MSNKTNKYFDKSREIAESLVQNPEKGLELISFAIDKYEDFKESNGRLGKMFRQLTMLVRIVRAHLRGDYKNLSWQKLIIATAAIVYLLYVVDVVPDFIPVIGLLDDAGVISWAVSSLQKEFGQFFNNKGDKVIL